MNGKQSGKLSRKTESSLKSQAILQRKECRPDWDIPHTLCSVYYMKKLIRKEGGNPRILVATMYLHDIGYPRLRRGYTLREVLRTKQQHVRDGPKLAEIILRKLNFSENEIDKITYLVKTHDDLRGLTTCNRQLVFEADSLGQIDWEKVRPTFDKENCEKWLEDFRNKRLKRFRTKTGKRLVTQLFSKSEKYLRKL